MPRPRHSHVTLPISIHPRWLTVGALRLAGLCLFIVLVGMIKWRLSVHSADRLLHIGGFTVIGAGVTFFTATRRLIAHLPLIDRSQSLAQAVLQMIRRIGLPLLGLAFFMVWTFIYIALWAVHPTGAFTGLGGTPRFADFFYYSVSTAFTSPPGDIVAASRGARSAPALK